MGNYRWPTGEVVGYAEIPEVAESGYTSLLTQQMPDDKAMVLQFENSQHLRSARNVIGIIAKRIGMKIGTKIAGQCDGKPRLYVWRRDAITPDAGKSMMEQVKDLLGDGVSRTA